MSPKLSVVMSAYNSADSIARAINSILNQSLTDFELIVLNDGSTDATEDVIQSFDDDRIRYFSLEHAGLPTALNYGIDQAQADFIFRHDSDDWSEPERFEVQLRELESNPEIDLVASWHNVTTEKGELLGLKKTAINDAALKRMLAWRSPFCHGAVAFRKESVTKLGGYNSEMLYSQDYDLWLRMAADNQTFSCIPHPLYNYSVTPRSIANGWYKMSRARAIRENAGRHGNSSSFSVSTFPEFSHRRVMALWYYAVGSLALENDHRKRAVRNFARSVFNHPLFARAYVKLGLALLPPGISNLLTDSRQRILESGTSYEQDTRRR